ncbi:MAG: 16S rRNA (guanine(527)-N(7))-methyltransferase RsmG [Bacteroidota bacterium]
MTNDEIWLRSLAQKNDLIITDIQLQKISRYIELLQEWNKNINLISRKDVENIWLHHIALSVPFLFKVEFAGGARILDLGTGGGLPGIPLSIVRPDTNFVLVDSIQKKTRAVQEMVASLNLPNVSVICSRAEDLNKLGMYRNNFDAVIARAVSSLENLIQWGMPFLKRTTTLKTVSTKSDKIIVSKSPALITMKGGDTEEEVERTRRRFPDVRIRSMDLIFKGSEMLQNSDKKLIIVENV